MKKSKVNLIPRFPCTRCGRESFIRFGHMIFRGKEIVKKGEKVCQDCVKKSDPLLMF
jgi:hypothetical protein